MSAFIKKYEYIFDQIHRDLIKSPMHPKQLFTKGSKLLDYGCGAGEATLRFSREYPEISVLGVDVHDAFQELNSMAEKHLDIDADRENLGFEKIGSSLSKVAIAGTEVSLDLPERKKHQDTFDFCYSWCVLEHVKQSELARSIQFVYDSLTAGGIFHVKINPLYYSMRGPHFNHILPEPWIHLKYQHDLLKSKFYKVGREKHIRNLDLIWQQYETLNKLTAAKLEAMLKETGFEVIFQERLYEGAPSDDLLEVFTKEVLTNKDVIIIARK